MSIYRVEVTPYARPFRQPLHTSHGIWAVREGAIVTLTAADGAIGQGEIATLEWFGTESLGEAIAFCAALQGEITTEQIFGIPDRFPCCQFGFESAIAQSLEPPKSPLVRGTLTAAVAALVSEGMVASIGTTPVHDPHQPSNATPVPPLPRGARGVTDSKRSPSIAALLPTGKPSINSWQTHHDRGHRTFKWKIGVNPIDDEIQWFRELHQQLPRDCQLRLDANAGLTLAETRQWLNIFEQYPIEYFEQPLAVDQFAAMQTLGETYATPIALDESIANLQSLQDCYDRGWAGIYVIKPAIVGSPRQLQDFLQCHALDVVFSSVFETEIGYAAGLRLAQNIGGQRALGYGTNHWWV
jgi:o-succinylbenzoate synthase